MRKLANTRAYLRTRHFDLTVLIINTQNQLADKDTSLEDQAFLNTLVVKMKREKAEIETCMLEIGTEIKIKDTITKEDVCQM